MKSKANIFMKNFSYTLSSNLISLLISTVVTLIVPKLIDVDEYALWQLYLFYSSYVGFLHFGWNDGIYLRYGGKEYNELDKELFFSQFYMLLILQVSIAFIILAVSNYIIFEHVSMFVYITLVQCMVVVNMRGVLLYILQATNRIKDYAMITMSDRIISLSLIILFLLIGIRDYKLIVMADIVGKSLSLIYAMYCCKDMVFMKLSAFHLNFKETIENINIGVKLMFANIASILIIGIVRIGIVRSWGIETFGKVSLTLSISNFLMLFINAVGLIMFPVLRRTDKQKLASIYSTMRDFLMIILLGMLILYYPIRQLLLAWLPKYTDSLRYMALLFPMCIYEGKMSLLINTYLKTLREEKVMLQINVVSLFVSLVFTSITTIVIRNLDLAILSIVIILAIRCILAEVYLANILKISITKDITLESVMTLIFIILGWYGKTIIPTYIYIVAYMFYLIIKRKDIIKTKMNLLTLLKS